MHRPNSTLVSATTCGELTALTIRAEDATHIQMIIDRIRKDDLLIIRVQEVRDSLEELFLHTVTDRVTGKPLPPGAAQGATE